MNDFTLKTYQSLLKSLIDQGYFFQTFRNYIEKPTLPPTSRITLPAGRQEFGTSSEGEGLPLGIKGSGGKNKHVGGFPLGNKRAAQENEKTTTNKCIILRHDVDKLPENSLTFAKIQHKLGIKGSYYFRAVPESWDERVIKEIQSLGHEIGCHYECLTTTNGNIEEGIKDFEKNLNTLRKLAPVYTICMHGSPASRWDSKNLWKHYNYKDYGIIAEPYFDVNFDNVFYLSDTGRRWDGWKVSVRDKVPQQEQWQKEGLVFHSTNDIIKAAEKGLPAMRHGELPNQIMFTFHPQRWTDKPVQWVKELILQNMKNVIKYFLVKKETRQK